MDKALYLAMSSGQNIMSAQAIRANNLANANTNGFQADFSQARAMGVYYGDGLPTRAYASTESPGTDFNRGALIETGRDLDMAVAGDGWIAVQAPDGSEAYTRMGSLKLDPCRYSATAGRSHCLQRTRSRWALTAPSLFDQQGSHRKCYR